MIATEKAQFYVVGNEKKLVGIIALGDLGRVLTHEGLEQILLAGDLTTEEVPVSWIRQLNVGFLCECFGDKRLQKNAGAPAGCVKAFL